MESALAESFIEALNKNAFYLDLVAKELAMRKHIIHQEVEDIVGQVAENLENLFALALDRLRWQKDLWQAVIKPVLGLLLTTSEPLPRAHLKRLLNLDPPMRVDGEQLDRGVEQLGGIRTNVRVNGPV